jgi:nicotinamidase-related amidase
MIDLHDGALIVVDVQKGFSDSDYWGQRNNPACESNVGALIEAFRAADLPVVYVRHDSVRVGASLHPESPGNAFKDELAGEPDVIISKRVNSAFYGTPDLREWLQKRGVRALAVCGITTNHCCETTTRMAGNLGYDTYFVLDATHTFDRTSYDGTLFTADELAAATAASLHDEFATIVATSDVVSALETVPATDAEGLQAVE